MKRIFIISILCFTIHQIFAQNEEGLPLIEMLEGNNSQKIYALQQIVEENLIEDIPAIEERVFLQETLYMQWLFLETLQKLNSPNISDLVYTYIDNIDGFMSPEEENPKEYKHLRQFCYLKII